MKHLAVVMGVVKYAVADLLAVDLMDPENLAFFDLERAPVTGGNDEFVDQTTRQCHCFRSLWVQS
jgi:hypothetical protein